MPSEDDEQLQEGVRPVQVEETRLPGVGLRHDFVTREGRRVGVVWERTGRRDLLVYDSRDPDACSESVRLRPEEADALAELLGAPRLVERLASLREQVPGLVTERVTVPAGSPFVGRTLGEARIRTQTGASVVAVLREQEVMPSVTPDFRFQAGDGVLIVGTRDGVEGAARILTG